MWGDEWLVACVEQPLTGSGEKTHRREVKDKAGTIVCII